MKRTIGNAMITPFSYNTSSYYQQYTPMVYGTSVECCGEIAIFSGDNHHERAIEYAEAKYCSTRAAAEADVEPIIMGNTLFQCGFKGV